MFKLLQKTAKYMLFGHKNIKIFWNATCNLFFILKTELKYVPSVTVTQDYLHASPYKHN